MHELRLLSQIRACPSCHEHFVKTRGKLRCRRCNLLFSRNKDGFVELALDKSIYETDTTNREYARIQESCGVRNYDQYLKPLLLRTI